MDLLRTVHPWLGYVVLVVLVGAAGTAFSHGRSSRELDTRLPVGATVLLDIQVTLGILLWATGSHWRSGPLIAWVHPVLTIAALVAGHVGIARARRLRLVTEAWAAIGRGLTTASVLVVLGIGVASAA